MGAVRKFDQPQFFVRLWSLIEREGPERLTFSRIARATQVARPTLYYYFGASVAALLREAGRSGARAVLQVNLSQQSNEYPNLRSYQRALIAASQNFARERPWALPLYFVYRNDAGPLGQGIRETEENYVRQQGELWQKYLGKSVDLEWVRTAVRLRVSAVYGLSEGGTKNQDNDTRRERFLERLTELIEESSF